MLYRKLGNTGLDVSVLGFGCMRLPVEGGAQLATDVFDPSKPIDEKLATSLIYSAIDAGVNLFDSAYGYHGGQSEVFLGKALAGRRESVMVSTKLPTWFVETAADFDKYLDEQLIRLNTNYLDIYMLHGLNRLTWDKVKKLNVLAFLDRIVREGRVRHVGFSFHGEINVFREIIDAYDWGMCLIQYNYFDEQFQAGRAGLEYAASKGVGVIAMEPLRGGKLTTAIPPEIQSIWQSADTQRTPAEWALRWVWNHSELASALSGMNSVEQLTENLRIAADAMPGTLNAGDLKVIGRVRDTYSKMLKVPCTHCAYCLPCPSGVNIPMNFSLYNDTFMFHDSEISRMLYTRMLAPEVRASNCSECAECESRCPQNINVIEELKKVHVRLSEE
jgi:uncharacterized protein